MFSQFSTPLSKCVYTNILERRYDLSCFDGMLLMCYEVTRFKVDGILFKINIAMIDSR